MPSKNIPKMSPKAPKIYPKNVPETSPKPPKHIPDPKNEKYVVYVSCRQPYGKALSEKLLQNHIKPINPCKSL